MLKTKPEATAARQTDARFITEILAEIAKRPNPPSDNEGTGSPFSGSSSPSPDDFEEQHSATEPHGNASASHEYSEDSDDDGHPELRATYG